MGMTMREMLLRQDARLDRMETNYEKRLRALEDHDLTASVERRTIMTVFGNLRSTILVAAAVGPIIAGVISVMVPR